MPHHTETCSIHQTNSLHHDIFANSNAKRRGTIEGHEETFIGLASSANRQDKFDWGAPKLHFEAAQMSSKKTDFFSGGAFADQLAPHTHIPQQRSPLYLKEDESDAGDKKFSVVDRIRWRNAYWLYGNLDMYNQNYIDVRDTASTLQSRLNNDSSLNQYFHCLVTVLEDLKHLSSSRGVIEKDVALAFIRRSIEEATLADFVYGPLRSNTFSISNWQKRDRWRAKTLNQSFYRASYTPRGIQQQLKHAKRSKYPYSSYNWGLAKQASEYGVEGGGWGPVDVSLAEHANISRSRRDQTVAALQSEACKKEVFDCTFRPELSDRRPLSQKELNNSKDMHQVERNTRLREAADFVSSHPLTFLDDCLDELGKTPVTPPRNNKLEFLKSFRKESVRLIDLACEKVSSPRQLIVHCGEAPVLKAGAWEDSLRGDWERSIKGAPTNFRPYADYLREVKPQRNLRRGLFSSCNLAATAGRQRRSMSHLYQLRTPTRCEK